MALPKETQERIKADAKSERIKWDGKIKEGVTEESRHHFLEGIHDGYIAGATAVAERAQKLVEALEEIAASNCDYESTPIAGKLHKPDCRACKAKEVLQQWKAGKGKDEPKEECTCSLTRIVTHGKCYKCPELTNPPK